MGEVYSTIQLSKDIETISEVVDRFYNMIWCQQDNSFNFDKLFNSSFTLFTCILSPIYNFYKFIIYKLKIISKLLIIFDNISIYMSFLVLLDLCFQCFYEYQYKYHLQIVCFLKT